MELFLVGSVNLRILTFKCILIHHHTCWETCPSTRIVIKIINCLCKLIENIRKSVTFSLDWYIVNILVTNLKLLPWMQHVYKKSTTTSVMEQVFQKSSISSSSLCNRDISYSVVKIWNERGGYYLSLASLLPIKLGPNRRFTAARSGWSAILNVLPKGNITLAGIRRRRTGSWTSASHQR